MSKFKGNVVIDNFQKEGLVEKTIDYFLGSGFDLVKQDDNFLAFIRGSLFVNGWTFNPLKWKSKVKIRFREDSVSVDFIVDATKQIPTKKEFELWELFICNYVDSLSSDIDYKRINKKAVRDTKLHALKLLGVLLLTGVLCGVVSVFLAIKTDLPLLISLGIAIPVLFVLVLYLRKYC